MSIVYVHNVNGHFLFTSFVYEYEGWVGGQKSPKFCLRSYWMPPYLDGLLAEICLEN